MFAYDKRFQKKTYGITCVGAGWHQLVGDVYDVIEKCVSEFPAVKVNVIQVKEKFATLRFYYGLSEGTESERHCVRSIIDLAVHLAHVQSSKTCEVCGKPGTQAQNRSRVETVCEEHKAPEETEDKNV